MNDIIWERRKESWGYEIISEGLLGFTVVLDKTEEYLFNTVQQEFPNGYFINTDVFRSGCLTIVKNQNTPKLRSSILQLQEAVQRARKKHPNFLEGKGHLKLVCLLLEELGEVAQAINDGNLEHAKNEVLDLAAVCIRCIEEM